MSYIQDIQGGNLTMHKTKKETESVITEAIAKFLKEQMAENVEAIITQVIEGAIIVRFKDILPPAEKNLIRDPEGIKLIKELKEKLIERAKPNLKTMIEDLVKVEIADIHSSFNIETGELITVFTLGKDLEKVF